MALQTRGGPHLREKGDWPVFLAGCVSFQGQGRSPNPCESQQPSGWQVAGTKCVSSCTCRNTPSSPLFFSLTVSGRLGDSSAKNQNKAARSEIFNLNFFFFF